MDYFRRKGKVRKGKVMSFLTWCLVGALVGAGSLFAYTSLTSLFISATNRPPLTTVQLAGSSTLFSDPKIEAELRRQGLAVEQNPLGSLAACSDTNVIRLFDISDSSRGAASCYSYLAEKARKVPEVYTPYGAPMVIMTYQPIVALLERLHIASEVDGITVFDVAKYLEVFASGERWSDIPGNTAYPSHNRILLSSTNPKQSDLGAILADIAYAAQNGGVSPTGIGPKDQRVPVIGSLFAQLGALPISPASMLQQFLAGGMAQYPMTLAYEDQYLNAALTHKATDPNLTVMYPTPNVFTNDTLVAWTPTGKRLIAALQSPQIVAIEESEGYRTLTDRAGFVNRMAAQGISVPDLDGLDEILQITSLPTDTVLRELVDAVTTSQPGQPG